MRVNGTWSVDELTRPRKLGGKGQVVRPSPIRAEAEVETVIAATVEQALSPEAVKRAVRHALSPESLRAAMERGGGGKPLSPQAVAAFEQALSPDYMERALQKAMSPVCSETQNWDTGSCACTV